MSEKLIIKNFGPIKSVEIELRRFNVIIGENATGKSTIAKLLAVCKYFSYIIDNTSPSYSRNSLPFFRGLSAWGLHDFLRSDTYIFFDNIHYSFCVDGRSYDAVMVNDVGERSDIGSMNGWNFNLKGKSQKFNTLLTELDKVRNFPNILSEPGELKPVPTSFFQNDVASVLDNPFYLPTERGLQSIFSLGKTSVQNIADSLFNQLANLDLVARNFKKETSIEPLNITYKNVDGRGYVRKNNEDEFYSLFNAASGYQSTIPVALVIKYYSEFKRKSKTFIIEEPELNLFPKAQNALINYLAESNAKYDNTFLLTTHSPYILTSLNNLMYAFEVGKDKPTETNKIIENRYWLDPKTVTAYMLLPDGTVENIIALNEDGINEGLIHAEKIDEITPKLNEQFEDLLNTQLVL